jgi:transcriptional regulator with XRE-family HTH domain
MSIQRKPRGFLASEGGVKLLESRKRELGLSYEEIANNANLGSDDQVKRLFNPHWERRVQRDTIDKIAKVLNLDPGDITETEDLNQLRASSKTEPASVVLQKLLCDIEVAENLEAEDVVQIADRGSSVEQILCTNLKAKDIKFGSLTQEV